MIVRTRSVQRCEVYGPVDGELPTVMVVYSDSFDDPDDDTLPVETIKTVHLHHSNSQMDEEGITTETVTDISGEDPMVVTICNAVWDR